MISRDIISNMNGILWKTALKIGNESAIKLIHILFKSLKAQNGGIMSKVIIENNGKVAILRLNNGVTNAINSDLIRDLDEAILTIKKEAQGMVLAGGDKFFSIGFDLPTLLKYTRAEMADFLYTFCGLSLNLFTLPLPTCCAMMGHAIAGGNILALTSDYRFAVSGKKLGLNEIKLGLPVPYLADLMLRQIVGDRVATKMLYSGEFMITDEAKQAGLVDEIFSPEEIEAQAVERISKIADLPSKAFMEIKANRVEEVRIRYEASSKNEILLDCWFSQPAQDLLQEAAKKFSK